MHYSDKRGRERTGGFVYMRARVVDVRRERWLRNADRTLRRRKKIHSAANNFYDKTRRSKRDESPPRSRVSPCSIFLML